MANAGNPGPGQTGPYVAIEPRMVGVFHNTEARGERSGTPSILGFCSLCYFPFSRTFDRWVISGDLEDQETHPNYPGSLTGYLSSNVWR